MKLHSRPPVGRGLWPVLVIGGLSLMFVTTLGMLGFLERINRFFAEALAGDGAEKPLKHLPDGWIWLASMVFAFGLAAAILGSAGLWRRCVLWLTAVVLIAGWAPVLSLVNYAPDISAPWIVAVCSGLCAMIYALRYPKH